MTILRNGVDLIEIDRVAASIERHGEQFLQRVFTPFEREQCNRKPASLAARFAAKEAVSKALGCGIGEVRWQEIEIRSDPRGKPELFLSGEAARLASQLGLTHWSVSLSHSREIAIAFVLAAGD